jgi:LmbE family N-acetylglucosaminyl deacetylase
MAVALFAFAHPDDETLAAGVAIAQHAAAGHEVHVLVLGRGQASNTLGYLNGEAVSAWWGVRHDPAAEGYAPLSAERFGRARVDECRRALDCLAGGRTPVVLHEGGLPDGGYDPAAVEQNLRRVCDDIAPSWLNGHSHLVDDHPDHVAVGWALRRLGVGAVRHYVLPRYWSDARLARLGRAWQWPGRSSVAARVVNACRAYGAWAPPTSYAIGHHSVYRSMFTPLMASPRSVYHL